MLTLTLCMAIVANAQELPYSKYLNFDKRDFKENKFKYDGETNTWAISKVNGWHTTFNILAIISRTSARTIDPKALKNVDESYNEYEFIIRTAVEPWSRYLEKQEEKSAKRDAKGKKKRSVNELM